MTGRNAKGAIKLRHLIIAIMSFLFIMAGLIYGIVNNEPDKSNWIKTIGVVQYYTYGRTGTRMFAYNNGQRAIFKARGGKGFSGGTAGDTYEILYNPENPMEIFVFEHRPVFLENETVGETVAEITNYTKIDLEGDEYVAHPEFTYNVNGKSYRRVQEIRLMRDSVLTLEKGMSFNVRYSVKNPQRSILNYSGK